MNWYKKAQIEEKPGIIAYHGSNESGIRQLRGGVVPYAGGIGDGVYLGFSKETAEYYGNHTYEVVVSLNWGQIFVLDSDSWSFLDQDVPESISPGEMIYPFAFRLGGQVYAVTSMEGGYVMDEEDMPDKNMEYIGLDDIGGIAQEQGYRGVYLADVRPSPSEELLIFDDNNVRVVRQIS